MYLNTRMEIILWHIFDTGTIDFRGLFRARLFLSIISETSDLSLKYFSKFYHKEKLENRL